ncbi:hypothetical protein MFIFM68171_08676 [Madurella fahalii]|uniref:Uncharacterized protein n=1 Tax=Madurella fahalii TaxID=1157608 RepID=A0ABQ0GL40_9PEZI
MKAALFALTALFASSLANPLPVESTSHLVPRTTKIDDIFAEVEARTKAAVAICVEADIDISAALEVREALAAKLKADLDACAELLASAAAEIEASAEAEIVASNGGCDAKCARGKLEEHTTKFCDDIKIIVEILGESCVKKYVKPCFAAFTKLVLCLDGVFAGIAASVGACVKAVLGASLGVSLGLGLDLGLGIGIGIGRT